MSDLNLRDRIRAISTDTGELNEHKVAEKLLGEMSLEERSAALAHILPEFVRNVLSMRWPTPEDNGAAPKVGQHRGQAVKAAWQAELQRVWTVDGGEKRFADFTTADCEFVEADRRFQASNLLAAADLQARAKEMLHKHRKTRVGDLPKAALDYVFGDPK